jgi:hypothetical protein
MAIDYAAKKLGQVVVSAMRSEQPLQQRLEGCIGSLGLLTVGDHLPPGLLHRLNEIIAARTQEADARQWLDKIHSLYEDAIAREQRELIAREILTARP